MKKRKEQIDSGEGESRSEKVTLCWKMNNSSPSISSVVSYVCVIILFFNSGNAIRMLFCFSLCGGEVRFN